MAGVALDCPVLASALEPDNGDILGISPPQHGQQHTLVNTINSGSNDSKYQQPKMILSKLGLKCPVFYGLILPINIYIF